MKDPIAGVSALAWEVKLCGEDAPAGSLDFEMKMTGSAGIECGYDGVEPPASLPVCELVSAQAEADTVVVTFFVRMPNLDKASGKRTAAIVEDESRNSDSLTAGRIGIKVAFEGGVRPEERPSLPLERQVFPRTT